MRRLTTIRARLYLLAFLALVPLLAMFAHAALAIHRVRRESELSANLELARATAAAFAAFVRDVTRTAIPIGDAMASGRLSDEEATEALRRAVAPYVAIRELSWTSPSGLILRSSNPRAVGLDVGDRDYLLRLRAGDDEALSDVLHARTEDGEVVIAARAVRDRSGRLLGCVLAVLAPERLGEKTLTLARTGGGTFALVDRTGRIAFRSPRLDLSWEDREIASRQRLVRRALEGEEASGAFVGEGGDERVGAAVPVPGYGWAARASRSVAEAFGPERREFARAGLVAALAAALSLGASALVGGRIVRTLRRLEDHAEALGRGERVPPPSTRAPEIARLAAAYARMAARLHASREAFVAAFDAAPVGIVLLDGGTLRTRWANRAFLALLEEPRRGAAVSGARVEELVPGAEERGLSRTLERVARGELSHSEWEARLARPAGDDAFWRWSVRPIPSADRVGARDLLLVGTDVTAQALARRRVEADRRRLQLLHDAGTLLSQTLELDEAARRLARFAVPELADLCSIEELRPDGSTRSLALAHADPAREAAARADRERFGLGRRSLAWRAIATRRTVHVPGLARADREAMAEGPEHLAALERAGLRSWIAIPLVASGSVRGVLTLANGESGRTFDDDDVRLAEELARHGAQALENARLFGEVQRAVRSRDEVLSVVSHDLRTPLGVVTLGAHALAGLPDAPGSLERARASGRRMLAAGRRMARLIGDLLDLASLQEGRLSLARAPCRPVDLLAEAVEEAKGLAREKGLALRCEADPGLPAVTADRGRVLQVIGNLVSNAVKVTEKGEVRLAAAREGAEVVFSVADTGPGIPEAERELLFERFRRGASAGYRGTGLGLAISRELVEAHGGRIWIESAPGAGAALRFTLPVAADGAGDAAGCEDGRAQPAQAGGGDAGPGAGALAGR